jgi:dGTPase
MEWDDLLCDVRAKEVMYPERYSSEDEGAQTEIDPRSQFQRDYDRTLFSTPVRRLQDKAQVFPLEPNDSVRTRLTHSLEVSNLAKSLARRATSHLVEEGEIDEEKAEQIVVIAGTCGLVHDLGNPPFGHAGERAMRGWFSNKLEEEISDQTLKEKLDSYRENGDALSSDFTDFDGNAQTIRLLTKLQMLADFDGLNLTMGTLSAALKYTAQSDNLDDDIHERDTPGFFFSEADIVGAVRERTGTGKARNPIAFLVEAADDIVYSAVDLEDGIKKGAISWKELSREFKESDKDNGLGFRLIREAEANIEERLEKSDLEEYSEFSDQSRAEAHAKMFRTAAIREHVRAVVDEFIGQYRKIMAGQYHGELVEDGNTGDFVQTCKRIAADEVFTSSDILRLETMGRRVIHDLMDFFWEGVNEAPYENPKSFKRFPRKTYELMSENYRAVFRRDQTEERIEDSDLPTEYRRLQLVADYISGMTDNFACSLHEQITNG